MSITTFYLAGIAPSSRMSSGMATYEPTSCGLRCSNVFSHGRELFIMRNRTPAGCPMQPKHVVALGLLDTAVRHSVSRD